MQATELNRPLHETPHEIGEGNYNGNKNGSILGDQN